MKNNNLLFLLPFLLPPAPLGAQTTIRASELASLAGMYIGTFSYLDFTSNQQVSTRIAATCKVFKNNLSIDISIAEGAKTYRQYYQYKFDGDRVHSEGTWTILEKQFEPANGKYRFVLTKPGRDGKPRKACLFRLTLVADAAQLTISKAVQFDGSPEFILRNEYRLQRLPGSP